MANRRFEEDVTAGLEYYLTEKEQQYSRELSEVRSHLGDRVKEVKTDLEKDIREVKTDLKDDLREVKADLKDDLKGIKDDLKGVKTQVMVLMGLSITSLIALIYLCVNILSN